MDPGVDSVVPVALALNFNYSWLTGEGRLRNRKGYATVMNSDVGAGFCTHGMNSGNEKYSRRMGDSELLLRV